MSVLNSKSQAMTFWIRLSKVLFPKRSAKMIDGSEKRKLQLTFELQSSHVFEKRSKSLLVWHLFYAYFRRIISVTSLF